MLSYWTRGEVQKAPHHVGDHRQTIHKSINQSINQTYICKVTKLPQSHYQSLKFPFLYSDCYRDTSKTRAHFTLNDAWRNSCASGTAASLGKIKACSSSPSPKSKYIAVAHTKSSCYITYKLK